MSNVPACLPARFFTKENVMLVLKRKRGEKINIVVKVPGSDTPITITLLTHLISKGSVSLGFEAPRKSVTIIRNEIAKQ